MSPAARMLTGPTSMSAVGLVLALALAGPGNLWRIFAGLDPALLFFALAMNFTAWFAETERFRATMARLGFSIDPRATFLSMSAGRFAVSSRTSAGGTAKFSRCHFLKAFPVVVRGSDAGSSQVPEPDTGPMITSGGLTNPRLCHPYIFSVILEVQAASAGNLLFLTAGLLLAADCLGAGISPIAGRAVEFARGSLGSPAGEAILLIFCCAAGMAGAFFVAALTFVTAFNHVIPQQMAGHAQTNTRMFLPFLTGMGWQGLTCFAALSGGIGFLALYSQALTAASLGLKLGFGGFLLAVLIDRVASAWNFTRWGLGTREIALGIVLPRFTMGCDASSAIALGLLLALPKALLLLVSATAFFKVKAKNLRTAAKKLAELNRAPEEEVS